MRTLVHLSDLHFGAMEPSLLPPLRDALAAARPDLIAISGDLTQRARVREFTAARKFLGELKCPTLVVPGNHDVPLFNFAARFLTPTRRYRRYISEGLAPVFSDREIVVVGLNTARRIALRGGSGRLNAEQVEAAVRHLTEAPADVVKVVVTHHPFDLPPGHHRLLLVGGAKRAMRRLAAAGADVFLAGHLHISHVGHTAERYRIAGHSALAVQAGTISWRSRGEASAFNVLRIESATIRVERHAIDARRRRFIAGRAVTFDRTADGWRPRK